MIVSIHQPNFLPWLGYFYKLIKCDIFVLLDNVQYTKNSYINRNVIKTPQGVFWLTVPVKTKGRFGDLIKDININNAIDWRRKHIGTLIANYKKAKYFNQIFYSLETIYYLCEWENLFEFNIKLIEWVLSIINLKRKIVRASDLMVEGKSTQLLVNIIDKLGGDIYLSGYGGVKYQVEETFNDFGISLKYYEFEHPLYPQLWGKFVPNLSVLDLLFNEGINSSRIIMDAK